MHLFLQNLLSDRKGGEIFRLFSGWHFLYIGLTLAAIISILLLLKNKEKGAKQRVTNTIISIAFGLYIADIFLMPLSYGEIDIEKLPFHVCTAMCVMCFLSHHNSFLEKYKTSFLLLGFISNLVYLIYPAGVMWHAVHPISYRVIQTLVFHSVMVVYGFVSLVYERERLDIKKCYKDLFVIIAMTLWAMIGNYTYNGSYGENVKFFNWFFVVRDPFYALPQAISPIIMPFLNIALFFGVEMIIHLVFRAIKKNKLSNTK